MSTPRLNHLIQLLEQGQIALGEGVIRNGSFEEIIAVADAGFAFLVLDVEHEGS